MSKYWYLVYGEKNFWNPGGRVPAIEENAEKLKAAFLVFDSLEKAEAAAQEQREKYKPIDFAVAPFPPVEFPLEIGDSVEAGESDPCGE